MFERRAIEQLITDHHRGAADYSDKLWALIQLELWFRTYVDTRSNGPITLDFADLLSLDRGAA
jgi:hypothetical protein